MARRTRSLALVALLLLLSLPAAASEWDNLTIGDVIPLCSQDAEACLDFAAAAIAWHDGQLAAGTPDVAVYPYCIRDGEDPVKVFAGLFTWYFIGDYRQRYDSPYVEPQASRYTGRPATWDDLMGFPAMHASALMSAMYPCRGVDYHPSVGALIRFD